MKRTIGDGSDLVMRELEIQYRRDVKAGLRSRLSPEEAHEEAFRTFLELATAYLEIGRRRGLFRLGAGWIRCLTLPLPELDPEDEDDRA